MNSTTRAPEQHAGPAGDVRVVVVDDVEDVRLLLRMALERDGRFVVVGEAADGVDAIAVIAELQPDLVVLDRQMPRLGGVEALPEIRARAPAAAVVLYTAQSDGLTRQAALAAGAVDVVEKMTSIGEVASRLADALMSHRTGPAAEVEVRVGPVDAHAARVWIANTEQLVALVRAHPDALDEPVDDDVFDAFARYLRTWSEIASTDDTFVWAAQASIHDVTNLLDSWAVIDRIPDARLAAIGGRWSPPAGAPFFAALTAGILDALHHHTATAALAEQLGRQWRPPPRPHDGCPFGFDDHVPG